jgi:hypothetical protein
MWPGVNTNYKKTPTDRNFHRSVDLALECFSNGRERYLDEWKALFATADERFVLHRVHVPKNNLLGILEVHWDVSGAKEI